MEPARLKVISSTGKETMEATVKISGGTIKVENGLNGVSNLHVRADSETWLGFLAKEKNLMWSLLNTPELSAVWSGKMLEKSLTSDTVQQGG